MHVQEHFRLARDGSLRSDVRTRFHLLPGQIYGQTRAVVPWVPDRFPCDQDPAAGQPFRGIDDEVTDLPRPIIEIDILERTDIPVGRFDCDPV